MASPTTPNHGKMGALYMLRPGGFSGTGLNDLFWGTGFSGAASAYYELEIDATGTPDTYKWRKNGGAYTTGVAITVESQILDDDQTVVFAATTGHTLGDKWAIGNLKDEATTESSAEAQITAATKRVLNPNHTPTFTDSGGANVLKVDHVRGMATFDANVAVVTVAGNNGYVPAVALQKVGYLFGIDYTLSLDLVDVISQGNEWKNVIPAQATGSAKADAYMAADVSFHDMLYARGIPDIVWAPEILWDSGGWDPATTSEALKKYFLLQIFNYDPDKDQTGDHLQVWCTLSGISNAAQMGDMVKEQLSMQFHGAPMFVANA